MVQIKPCHWLALIGFLAVLNVLVLAGLAMLLTGLVPWDAAGRGVPRAGSSWAAPRATLPPTFTPTAASEIGPASAALRLPAGTPEPSATQVPSTLTTATPTRTRVPTRTPRAAKTSLSEFHSSGQPAGLVMSAPTSPTSPRQTVVQQVCGLTADGQQCGWEDLSADRKANLSWRPVAKSVAYRVYSDMGTGYGVYVFKAETGQPALSDTQLRAGWRYDYRVQPVVRTGNKQLVSLARSQWIPIMAIMSSQPAGITRESDYAAIVLAN